MKLHLIIGSLAALFCACPLPPTNVGEVDAGKEPLVSSLCTSDWSCDAGDRCNAAGACEASCTSGTPFSFTPGVNVDIRPTEDGGISFGTMYGKRAVGDVNQDGHPDMVAIPSPPNGMLALFVGKGDGTFVELPFMSVGEQFTTIAIADVTRDGVADVVASSESGVYVHKASLPGLFQAPTRVFQGPARNLSMVDLTNDGQPELVTAGVGLLSVLTNQADGGFSPSWSTVVADPSSLAVGDLDGDMQRDLILTQSSGLLTTYLHTPMGYTLKQSLAAGSAPDFAQLSDMNGDGRLDVVLGNRNSTAVLMFKNEGSGTLAEATRHVGVTTVHSLLVNDINRDSRPDVLIGSEVVTSTYGFASCSALFSAMLNDGRGKLEQQAFPLLPISLLGLGTCSVALGDFNSDKNIDVISGNMFGGQTYSAGACR